MNVDLSSRMFLTERSRYKINLSELLRKERYHLLYSYISGTVSNAKN